MLLLHGQFFSLDMFIFLPLCRYKKNRGIFVEKKFNKNLKIANKRGATLAIEEDVIGNLIGNSI